MNRCYRYEDAKGYPRSDGEVEQSPRVRTPWSAGETQELPRYLDVQINGGLQLAYGY